MRVGNSPLHTDYDPDPIAAILGIMSILYRQGKVGFELETISYYCF